MSLSTHERNVASGLKAAIHNDRVSDEAKANAAQRLEEMGSEVPDDFRSSETDHSNDLHANQQRGFKSVLSRSDVSDEAKAHAREMLGEDVHSSSHGRKSDDESENRRMGGYKATLKNPNVSDEAKEHAEEVLKEHGVY